MEVQEVFIAVTASCTNYHRTRITKCFVTEKIKMLFKAIYCEENCGTLFLPKKKKKLSFYGKWIKTVARIEGKIFIDSTAFGNFQQIYRCCFS